MKRGRKPAPSAVKKAKGNPGKRPVRDWVEPKPLSSTPSPPKHLDAIAAAEWRRLAPELTLLGTLSAGDIAVFCAYCQAWSIYLQADRHIQAAAKDKKTFGGLMLATAAGNMIQSPMVGTRNTALRDMLRYAAELGLTPAARVRVQDAAPGAAAAAARAAKPATPGKGESYFAD